MEYPKFLWGTALSFLPVEERVVFRLLSKNFDQLVLNTLTEIIVNEDNPYSEEMIDRFGSFATHLYLNSGMVEFDYMAEKLKNIDSITFGDRFNFVDDYPNYDDIDSDDEDCDEDSWAALEMNFKNIHLLSSVTVDGLENLVDNKDLSSFAYNVADDPDETDIILNQLSFRNLKWLGAHAACCGVAFSDLLKKKSKQLLELEFHQPRFEGDEPYTIPGVSSLEVARFSIGDQQTGYLSLNNSEQLPNLRKLDIFQQDRTNFDIRDLGVWPQIKTLRLRLKQFQTIDFKTSFPYLKELSFSLHFASPAQTRAFLSSIENIRSLFIRSPKYFEFPESTYFLSLNRLSFVFKYTVSPNVINWISSRLPNLIELSVVSKENSFEKAFLETTCHFASLMRFISSDELTSKFWIKLVSEAPKLVDVHIKEDWLEKRMEFQTFNPRIAVSPYYNLEGQTFPDFLDFY